MAAEEDWASLEQGLLHDIFLRLDDDANAARFRAVCSQWRAAAAGAGVVFVPRPWLAVYAPEQRRHAWLRPSRRRRRGRRRFKRVDDGEVSLRPERGGSPAPAAVSLVSVSRGWVAMKHGESHLVRAVSGDEVPLPPCGSRYELSEVPLPPCGSRYELRYELSKVILPDDPLAAAASGEWTAFAFMSHHQQILWPHTRRVAFCHAGDDEWTFLDKAIQAKRYRGLEFFRGRAYVLLSNLTVAVGDVVSRMLIATSVGLSGAYRWRHDELLEATCLVRCSDDLLLVQVSRQVVPRRSCFPLLAGGRHRRRRLRLTSRVYKLEFAADGSGVPVGFTKVESIGEYALFVSRSSHAFALPASGAASPASSRIASTTWSDYAARSSSAHRGRLAVSSPCHWTIFLSPGHSGFHRIGFALAGQ
uniref:KIB1-4 beta-propeller domain-containing protein n=1 Tax=Oryza meridionalis TaxID=40149 RepID=A0A0E0F000_9ORYZ